MSYSRYSPLFHEVFVLLYTPAAVDNGSSLCLLFPFTPLTFLVLVFQQLALYVLSFLEPKDLLQAAQTCRYWRILAEDNLLWREKCREEGECKVSVTDVEGDNMQSPSGSSLELPLCLKLWFTCFKINF